MAKKVAVDSKSILDSIKAKVIGSHPLGNAVVDERALKVTNWISTGNYNLNMAISGSFFRGIPDNTITALVGDSGVGKTFILMNIYRDAISKGYTIYHFDTEGAVNDEMLINFGLMEYKENGTLNIIPVGIIEDLNHMFHGILEPITEARKQGDYDTKVLVGIDSIGNIASRKEFEDAKSGNEKVDMTSAKKVASFFRQITEPCSTLKIPVIITNHIYVTQDFIPQVKLKKGNALVYAASNIVLLRKAQLKENTEKVGILVTAVPHKNRFVRPMEVKFHIHFTQGMNKYVGLDEYIKNPKQWDCEYEKIGIGCGKPGKNEFEYSKVNTGFYVKHLDKKVKKASEVFRKSVFTDEILQKMEESIKSHYLYTKSDELEEQDLEEFVKPVK